jgi:hypothetical protein
MKVGTKWAPLYGYLGIFGVGPTRVIPALNHQVYPASKNIWSINILYQIMQSLFKQVPFSLMD